MVAGSASIREFQTLKNRVTSGPGKSEKEAEIAGDPQSLRCRQDKLLPACRRLRPAMDLSLRRFLTRVASQTRHRHCPQPTRLWRSNHFSYFACFQIRQFKPKDTAIYAVRFQACAAAHAPRSS